MSAPIAPSPFVPSAALRDALNRILGDDAALGRLHPIEREIAASLVTETRRLKCSGCRGLVARLYRKAFALPTEPVFDYEPGEEE